jgi:hypothetical protein
VVTSDTEIANLAISHLGTGKVITDLETDRSQEAEVCRTFYEIGRDKTLRGYRWPFATKFAELNLVEEDPTTEWEFSYRYPADCLMLRRIIGSSRVEVRSSKIPYKIGKDASG